MKCVKRLTAAQQRLVEKNLTIVERVLRFDIHANPCVAGLGYEVSLIDLAAVEIPVALFSLVVSCVYIIVKDNRISKKYYEKSAGKKAQK